jgi:hypothetical protein
VRHGTLDVRFVPEAEIVGSLDHFAMELSRFDIWLQTATGSGSDQTAVRSTPTAIPTEISRNRWTAIIHAGSARATSMTMANVIAA